MTTDDDITSAYRRLAGSLLPPGDAPERIQRRVFVRGRRRVTLAAFAAVAVLATGGLAAAQVGGTGPRPLEVASAGPSRSPSPRTPEPTSPSVIEEPYVSAHRLASLLGLHLAPAGTGTPEVSRSEVLGQQDWSRRQVPHARPIQVLLRRVTDTQFGPIDTRGTVTPVIENRLSWVVIVPDVLVCSSGGPVAPSGGALNGPDCGPGMHITIVDAGTGKQLLGLDF